MSTHLCVHPLDLGTELHKHVHQERTDKATGSGDDDPLVFPEVSH